MKVQETQKRTRTVRLERLFPHAPERVWQALTDPQALAQWLLPNTFEPRLGHHFRLTRMSEAGKRQKVSCRVVELEAPSRLAYTWQAEDEALPTLVAWTLEAVEEGTCLRLEHIGPEAPLSFQGEISSIHALGDLLQTAGGSQPSAFGKRARLASPRQAQRPARLGQVVLASASQPLRCISRRSALMPTNRLPYKEVSRCSR